MSERHPRGTDIAIGLHYRATDLSMSLLDFAKAGEERDFRSIYFAEHTHFPVERRLPYPGAPPQPENAVTFEAPLTSASAPGFSRYQRLWDPYIAMADLAPQVSLRLGTCISLVAEHDAIALAKAIATLDHFSHGRIVIGVGQGWLREEFEDHGLPFAAKRQVLREKILLMKEIWTKDVASFQGEFVSLKPSYSWPKPCQKPHPPILLGCRATRSGFDEIVAWADGWIPMRLKFSEALREELRELRSRWNDAGRDGTPRIVVMNDCADKEECVSAMDGYRELGVDEVLLDIPTDSADVLLPLLDRLADWCQLR